MLAEWHSPSHCSKSESGVCLFAMKSEATFLIFHCLIFFCFDGGSVLLLTLGLWLFLIYWPSKPDPSPFSMGTSLSSKSFWMVHGTIFPCLVLYPQNSNGLSPCSNLSHQWLIKASTSLATIFDGSLMLNLSRRVSRVRNMSLLLYKLVQGQYLCAPFPAGLPVKCQWWDFQEEC